MNGFNNFLASWVLLSLTVLTFSGQFLYLRLVTLSLAVAFAGGAYAAASLGPGNAASHLFVGIIGGMTAAAIGGIFDRWAGVRVRALALLASFGFLKIFQALIEIIGKGGVGAFPVTFPLISISPYPMIHPSWLPIGIIGLLTFSLLLWVAYKIAGLRLSSIAVGDDDALAALFGISATHISVNVQLLGGAIGGFTGVLMAADAGLRPDLGFNICIKAFGVLIATGGRWIYLLPLTVLMVFVENTAAYYFGGHAKEFAGFILLAIVLTMRPCMRTLYVRRYLPVQIR
jgi:branched-subunit amino acid ABC-type transport system permease component